MRSASHVPISYVLPDWLRKPAISFLVGNELRAVFPIVASSVLFMMLAGIVPVDFRIPVTVIGYCFGCASISAMAFGHDFTHRTLALSLAQPVSRASLWRVRMRIILISMVPLALIAGMTFPIVQATWRVIFNPNDVPTDFPIAFPLFLVPLLVGLCVAPWLTLISRSALAGAVFSISLPFVLYFSCDALESALFRDNITIDHQRMAWNFFFIAFGIVCAFGFFDAWRRFQRLEVIDPQRGTFGFSIKSAFRTFPSRIIEKGERDSPWVHLVVKELRLQWIALVPTAGMLITAYSFRNAVDGRDATDLYFMATIAWAVATCLMIGGVGSAEERQWGVTESQALLPMRRSTQWLIKVAVLLALGQLLAVNLPYLAIAGAIPSKMELPGPLWRSTAAFLLVSLSLYLSSISKTTMKAVLLSLPMAVIAIGLLGFVHLHENAVTLRNTSRIGFGEEWSLEPFQLVTVATSYLLVAGIIALLLRFGFLNHFSADGAGPRLLHQACWLIGLTFVAIVFCTVLYFRAVG